MTKSERAAAARLARAERAKIGKRIRALREMVGMRPSELARRLGVSHPSLFAWECGKTSPALQRIPAIADALGVSVSALYGKKAA